MMASWWRRWRDGTGFFLAEPAWLKVMGSMSPAEIMRLPYTDRHHAKQGRSTGRLILQHDGQTIPVYLKRHYRFSWLEKIRALIAPKSAWSPAWLEWEHLQWARTQGIPVPEALAVGQWYGPGLQCRSYLALRELSGQKAINELLPFVKKAWPSRLFQCWWRSALVEIARLARLMHDLHHYHKDLYLCHFYAPETILTQPSVIKQGQVRLIDLHRLTYHPLTGHYWRIKDLAQLLYSSYLPEIVAQDRVRFFRAYLGVRKLTKTQRSLARVILIKANRYLDHNLARDRQKHALPSVEQPVQSDFSNPAA